MKNVCVIGAGASGIISAITAAKAGDRVTVLEKESRPLIKLAKTGNGRCNLANLRLRDDGFHSKDEKRAGSLFAQYGLHEIINFFESLGILTVDEDGWVYPMSKSAASVSKILLSEAEHLGVKIKTNEEILDIVKVGDGFSVKTDGWTYKADKVIISCGTGASLENGTAIFTEGFSKRNGIKFHKYLPALVKLNAKGSFLNTWAGVRTKADVSLLIDGECAESEYGEIQLVNTGISGIPVFQISGAANEGLDSGKKVSVMIDFLPELKEDELKEKLEALKLSMPYRTFSDILKGFVPEKLIKAVINYDMDAKAISHTLKNFELEITKLSEYRDAQVCSGGIDLGEISDGFELLKMPGVFVTGEALDVDGRCGGYNLMWAWSSGTVAGKKAAL